VKSPKPAIAALAVCCLLSAAAPGAINVTYTIGTEQGRSPISPYIYGSNFTMAAAENFTIRRIGGNQIVDHADFALLAQDWGE